jgi:hypothetical protein
VRTGQSLWTVAYDMNTAKSVRRQPLKYRICSSYTDSLAPRKHRPRRVQSASALAETKGAEHDSQRFGPREPRERNSSLRAQTVVNSLSPLR